MVPEHLRDCHCCFIVCFVLVLPFCIFLLPYTSECFFDLNGHFFGLVLVILILSKVISQYS
jgi:hypothetical protein